MTTSNCLFGAVRLMLRYRTLRLRMLVRGRTVPHFYVIDRRGRRWHFRLVRDVFPAPLCYVWFHGRYARMRPAT